MKKYVVVDVLGIRRILFRINGVIDVVSGYANGKLKRPIIEAHS